MARSVHPADQHSESVSSLSTFSTAGVDMSPAGLCDSVPRTRTLRRFTLLELGNDEAQPPPAGWMLPRKLSKCPSDDSSELKLPVMSSKWRSGSRGGEGLGLGEVRDVRQGRRRIGSLDTATSRGRRGGVEALGVLPRAAADGDVAEGAAFGPVAAAVLAEVTRLQQVVVVVVAELGVGGFAPGAPQILLLLGKPRPCRLNCRRRRRILHYLEEEEEPQPVSPPQK
ncbi:hypothetical protein C4D60_Mb04t37640 [Musa balbisiana]|uniref:Uncharacterized protein n=1 Tax=Musa balbisiana TaxID=52838 RepID=A0A4S8KHI8_MUSBA|nr:hypothetical protein C4D60_Mb04t37640 [Musa balbisiana]